MATKPASPTPEEIILQQRDAFHQLLSECNACQEEIEPHWQFCAHCGVRLATQCPGCGAPLPPAGAHSCPGCGLAIPQIKATKST
jgi:predicted amidophosphoribosyltransferase